jgi:hypothetical protein
MGETTLMAWLRTVHAEKGGRFREGFNLHWMSVKWPNPFSPIVAKLYAKGTYQVRPSYKLFWKARKPGRRIARKFLTTGRQLSHHLAHAG